MTAADSTVACQQSTLWRERVILTRVRPKKFREALGVMLRGDKETDTSFMDRDYRQGERKNAIRY